MTKKSTKWHVQSAKLQGGKETQQHILDYLNRTEFLSSVLAKSHPEVTIHEPEVDPKSGDTFIDISGEKKLVTAAIKECDDFLKRVHHIIKQVEVDPVLHRTVESRCVFGPLSFLMRSNREQGCGLQGKT